jgi:hypothetical protein
MLKMVADISSLHNIQDYFQPIQQPPSTKRVIIKVTTAMVVYKEWLDLQRMSEKFQYHYTYLLTTLCLCFDDSTFQVCFQTALKENITSQPSTSNQSSAEPKEFQFKQFLALHMLGMCSLTFLHRLYITSSFNCSFLPSTTNIYETAGWIPFCSASLKFFILVLSPHNSCIF